MNEHRGLWRAKRVDNGQWVKGYYVCLNNEGHLIYNGYAETDCCTYYPDYYTINPSTLGECTGLTDKNGEPLFEGDIVKGKNERLFAVEYSAGICAFVARAADGVMVTPSMNTGTMKCYEIVGNIHDNF